MSYELPKEAEILWLDSYYKSDSFEQGRLFKQFFKSFCEQAFALNLNIYQDLGGFPIAFDEQNAYSSISYALHTLTPYAQSEVPILHKAKRIKGEVSLTEHQNGRVDFWCMEKERKFETWLESKKLWLNIGTKEWQFTKSCEYLIDNVFGQIKRLKNAGVDKKANKYAEGAVFKVALLQIPIVYNSKHKPSNEEIESAPKYLESLLAEYLENKMGLLLGALDMRPFGGDEVEGECNPYNILAAVVIQ
ncbi:hypothetical protein [Helicobacter sp. MIT 05-5294]|uniref:hypothetical protein n=1 Tax=Helicobacter sp. MIT 05-5294 TaxID=1548150 RepID=UPI00051FDDEB|nr:hypothetical protein [Helicobacter sp. MIT 05-5294]TLD87263.1 hypothetical protein LS69_004390 [Helicobacter sp. MIT 05-5294]